MFDRGISQPFVIMPQCSTRGVMDALERSDKRHVPSSPPGFSDLESSMVSRERRRVALVCQELGAELLDKVKATNDEMESRLCSKVEALTASVNELWQLMSPPVNCPPCCVPAGPVPTWCYWMPANVSSQPEGESSPDLLHHAQAFTLHSPAASEAGDGRGEGCGGHAASWQPVQQALATRQRRV